MGLQPMTLEQEVNDFLRWEVASRDTIDLKVCYIDMADGDIVTGLLLSQIVYWHLPSKETGRTKLRVTHDGELWVSKARAEWFDECRITPKQFDRAIKTLEEKGIVVTGVFKFNGNPTKHVRINWPVFISLLNRVLELGYSPKVNNDIPDSVTTLTETTTENTTIINLTPDFQSGSKNQNNNGVLNQEGLSIMVDPKVENGASNSSITSMGNRERKNNAGGRAKTSTAPVTSQATLATGTGYDTKEYVDTQDTITDPSQGFSARRVEETGGKVWKSDKGTALTIIDGVGHFLTSEGVWKAIYRPGKRKPTTYTYDADEVDEFIEEVFTVDYGDKMYDVPREDFAKIRCAVNILLPVLGRMDEIKEFTNDLLHGENIKFYELSKDELLQYLADWVDVTCS